MSDKTFNEIVVGRKILGIEISDSKGSDSIAVYNSGSYIGELILDTELFELEKKLQAAEEENRKLKKLFKDQGGCIVSAMSLLGKLQAAEENLKELQEQAVADIAIREKLLHENRVLREAVADIDSEIKRPFGLSNYSFVKCKENVEDIIYKALEKVGGGE